MPDNSLPSPTAPISFLSHTSSEASAPEAFAAGSSLLHSSLPNGIALQQHIEAGKSLEKQLSTQHHTAGQDLTPHEQPDYYKTFRRGITYVYAELQENDPDKSLQYGDFQLKDGESFLDDLRIETVMEYCKKNPETLFPEGTKIVFGVNDARQGIIPIYTGQIAPYTVQSERQANSYPIQHKKHSAMSNNRALSDLQKAHELATSHYQNQIFELQKSEANIKKERDELTDKIKTLSAEVDTLHREVLRLKPIEERFAEEKAFLDKERLRLDDKERELRANAQNMIDKRDEEFRERFQELRSEYDKVAQELRSERLAHEQTKLRVNSNESERLRELTAKNQQLELDYKLLHQDTTLKLGQAETNLALREQQLVDFYNQKLQQKDLECQQEIKRIHDRIEDEKRRAEFDQRFKEIQTLNDERYFSHEQKSLREELQEMEAMYAELEEESSSQAYEISRLKNEVLQLREKLDAKPSAGEAIIQRLTDQAPRMLPLVAAMSDNPKIQALAAAAKMFAPSTALPNSSTQTLQDEHVQFEEDDDDVEFENDDETDEQQQSVHQTNGHYQGKQQNGMNSHNTHNGQEAQQKHKKRKRGGRGSGGKKKELQAPPIQEPKRSLGLSDTSTPTNDYFTPTTSDTAPQAIVRVGKGSDVAPPQRAFGTTQLSSTPTPKSLANREPGNFRNDSRSEHNETKPLTPKVPSEQREIKNSEDFGVSSSSSFAEKFFAEHIQSDDL